MRNLIVRFSKGKGRAGAEIARQPVDAAMDEGKAVVNETKRIARKGMEEVKTCTQDQEVDDALQE